MSEPVAAIIQTLEDRTLLAAPVFAQSLYSFSVNEDVPIGAIVGTVNATDPEGQAVDYFLDNDGYDGAGPFDIDAISGAITTTRALDFETTSWFSLWIIATDTDWNEGYATVDIAINDVDEAPILAPYNFSFSIDENMPVGTVVGSLAANDPQNDPLTFYLNDGADNTLFAVDELTGDITLQKPLDFESQSMYFLTGFAEDPDGNSGSGTVDITVNDVSGDAVFDAPSYAFSVSEDSAIGTLLGAVSASDPEGQGVSYSLDAFGSGLFGIDSVTGDVTLQWEMNYEEYPIFDVTVHATDPNGIVTSAPLTVTVLDVDETPEPNNAPTISNLSFTITEYGNGIAIGFLSGTISDDYVTEGGFQLEVDVDNDGFVDWIDYAPSVATSIASDGEITYGTHDVAARITEFEGETGNPIPGPWTVATLSIDPASNNAPTIANLAFTLDDGFGLGHFEPYGFFGGDITDATRTFGYYDVQVDLNNDGIPDDFDTFETDATTFVDDVLAQIGSNTYAARVVEYDYNSGQTLEGAWVSLTFNVDPPPNAAPTIDFAEFDGIDNGMGALDGEIYGEYFDDLIPGSSFVVEIDYDGDGTADWTTMGVDGTFTDFLSMVPAGAALQARVIETDVYGREFTSAWAAVAVGAGTERNVAPQFASSAFYLVVDSGSLANGVIPGGIVSATDANAGDTVTYKKSEGLRVIVVGGGLGSMRKTVPANAVSINAGTGQVSITDKDFLKTKLEASGFYTFTVFADDGKTKTSVVVYVVDNYLTILNKIESHINSWRTKAGDLVWGISANANVAATWLRDFLKKSVASFSGTTTAITSLTWVMPTPTAVNVAAVLSNIAANAVARKEEAGYIAIVREMQREIAVVRKQDLSRLDTTQKKELRAYRKLLHEVSQLPATATPLDKTLKVLPHYKALKTRLPEDVGTPPKMNDIYGAMLLKFVDIKGWKMVGSKQLFTAWGKYWHTHATDKPDFWPFSLDVTDLQDELNRIEYYPGGYRYITSGGLPYGF